MQDIESILLQEKMRLSALIDKIESELKNKPQESLRLSLTHGYQRYYLRPKNSSQYRYADEKDAKLVRSIAQSEYNERLLPVLKKKLGITSKHLKIIQKKEEENVFLKMPAGRKALVSPSFSDCEEYVRWWESVKYVGKPFAPGDPEIWTERGERVRSKSEKMIADRLYFMGVPYRYEYPVKVAGYGTIYADFLILDVVTGEEYILEHFGMMDDKQYCDNALRKIHTYNKAGIIAGEKLLITFESSSRSLDTSDFERMIRAKIHVKKF